MSAAVQNLLNQLRLVKGNVLGMASYATTECLAALTEEERELALNLTEESWELLDGLGAALHPEGVNIQTWDLLNAAGTRIESRRLSPSQAFAFNMAFKTAGRMSRWVERTRAPESEQLGQPRSLKQQTGGLCHEG